MEIDIYKSNATRAIKSISINLNASIYISSLKALNKTYV